MCIIKFSTQQRNGINDTSGMPALRAGPARCVGLYCDFTVTCMQTYNIYMTKRKKMFKLSINSSFSFPFYPLLCLDYFSILNVLPIIYFSVQLYWFFTFFFLFPITFSR